ncbi:hypothetical protein E8E13_008934 [Curvularia kusanoi]|uniref:Xylanolytic transcriptional activator regulatory domain-containing protein n=1 Tax=Curvularia kusanoi TaxID=90978 RepID=A0A9P4TD70_CURKU|nr:hypothetical protein E8E13_008934 [Curvularia kusanoi]
MSILSKVFHGQQLNLESLRKISKAIKDGSLILPTLNAETYIEPNQSPEDDDDYSSSAGTPVEWAVDVDGETLHEPLGSMMRDSKNVLRYVGSQSDIPFNGAVANFCQPPKKATIIPPARLGAYPPTEEVGEEFFWLPPKQDCFDYVKRYRAQVHCMYWLYPEEKLLQRIEDTYAWYETAPPQFQIKLEHGGMPTPPIRRGEKPSVSWICSIYAMCAVGAAPRGPYEKSPSPAPHSHTVAETTEDYMAKIKQLKSRVEDSADVDSIRAFAIAALALENAMLSRVTAYLYVGAAIQMAWSLGLHRDQPALSGSEEERIENRRIWWTLTTLDLEIGLRCGSPTLIDDEYLEFSSPLPLERIGHEPVKTEFLGIYTPRKWLSAYLELSNLKRGVIHKMTKIAYERLAKETLAAAGRSVELFKRMVQDRTISSLTTFDSTALLRCITISMCAFGYYKTFELKQLADDCMKIAQSMERIGFAKMINQETPQHIEALGMSLERNLTISPQSNSPLSYMPREPSPSDTWHMQQVTALQNQQAFSLDIDDNGIFDPNSDLIAYEENGHGYSNVFQPQQMYPEFNPRWQ